MDIQILRKIKKTYIIIQSEWKNPWGELLPLHHQATEEEIL